MFIVFSSAQKNHFFSNTLNNSRGSAIKTIFHYGAGDYIFFDKNIITSVKDGIGLLLNGTVNVIINNVVTTEYEPALIFPEIYFVVQDTLIQDYIFSSKLREVETGEESGYGSATVVIRDNVSNMTFHNNSIYCNNWIALIEEGSYMGTNNLSIITSLG